MTDALDRLLAEERRLLLAADWPSLDALAARKALALEGLGSPTPALAEALRRNQALLAAAIEGLREAGRRRLAMADARALRTYDASGAPAALAAPRPRHERRA